MKTNKKANKRISKTTSRYTGPLAVFSKNNSVFWHGSGLIRAGLFLASLFIFGCASGGKAPIEARTQPPSQKINTHVVEPGDTLYSVAWRYQKDYRQLAAINGITEPFLIHRGQKLQLTGTAASRPVAANAPAVTVRTAPARTTSVSTADSPASVAATAAPRVLASAPVPAATSSTASTPVLIPQSVDGWNWPLQGRVVKAFGSNTLTKGMTIDSSQQKDVVAAADGLVVYAGSGVRGYGNFLILKHSDLFLSAYAYNEQLWAKEGDQVRMGQKIASAGNDSEGNPRLYFEIRKDGQPVDPVRYLPKR